MMQFANSFLLAFIGVLYSAAAAPVPDDNPAASCVVPQIFFDSLPNPFTISVLVPGPSTSTNQASWALQLSPRNPSETVASDPVISLTKILSPSFRLVNQTLVTADDGFPADLLPVITIFPPPLQGFQFGGPLAGETPGTFGAIYACDTTGQVFLKLVADQAPGFAVNSVAEGERVYIKPSQFAGTAVDVSLRIDGGQ